MVLFLIVFIGIVYLMICVGYFVFHRFFILFPSRKLAETPSDFHLQYEEVFFKTSDNVRLQGWFIHGKPSEECEGMTFILFPGNKGTMADFLMQISHLVKAGFHVFLFGYRGFGKSDRKRPTERGVFHDSEAACEYLLRERNIALKSIVFFGQSLGCAMASFTASRFDPRGLILEGGFPSLVEVAARAVKWLPLRLLTTSRFETQKYLADVRCPVLIVHSRDDKAIPFSDAENLFRAVSGLKKKIVISGPHAKGLENDKDRYLNEVRQFLCSV